MKKNKPSKELKREFAGFVDTMNINRLNRHLRFMLLAYLNDNKCGFPLYHEDLLFDLEFLFYFLDAVEKEQKGRDIEP
jgi:hypothetical protein